MSFEIHLQYAHHEWDESEVLPAAGWPEVQRAFDTFDWVNETKRAEELQRVSPTILVKSDDGVSLIWVSSLADGNGIKFYSECTFLGVVERGFGLRSQKGKVSLHTREFTPTEAREALRLFMSESFDDLSDLYGNSQSVSSDNISDAPPLSLDDRRQQRAMSLLRILGGVMAAVAVMATIWAIVWHHPRIGGSIVVGGFCMGWGWLILRSLKTGVVVVREDRYLRSKSPIAYWGYLGFYTAVGLYAFGAAFYAIFAF